MILRQSSSADGTPIKKTRKCNQHKGLRHSHQLHSGLHDHTTNSLCSHWPTKSVGFSKIVALNSTKIRSFGILHPCDIHGQLHRVFAMKDYRRLIAALCGVIAILLLVVGISILVHSISPAEATFKLGSLAGSGLGAFVLIFFIIVSMITIKFWREFDRSKGNDS